MSRSFPHPERVPTRAVERLLQQFSGLLDALRAAADSAETPRLEKAQDLLTVEQLGLAEEAAAFLQGDRTPLLQHAWDLRRLARRMDGRMTSDIEEDLAKKLWVSQQLVVLTAWQISAAASGSEAAGL